MITDLHPPADVDRRARRRAPSSSSTGARPRRAASAWRTTHGVGDRDDPRGTASRVSKESSTELDRGVRVAVRIVLGRDGTASAVADVVREPLAHAGWPPPWMPASSVSALAQHARARAPPRSVRSRTPSRAAPSSSAQRSSRCSAAPQSAVEDASLQRRRPGRPQLTGRRVVAMLSRYRVRKRGRNQACASVAASRPSASDRPSAARRVAHAGQLALASLRILGQPSLAVRVATRLTLDMLIPVGHLPEDNLPSWASR